MRVWRRRVEGDDYISPPESNRHQLPVAMETKSVSIRPSPPTSSIACQFSNSPAIVNSEHDLIIATSVTVGV
jgi:hypothetical protein